MNGHLVNGKFRNFRSREVSFLISDVYVPEPAQILAALHGQETIHGKIVDLSDGGTEREVFAVVEVDGLNDPIIVPISKVTGTEDIQSMPKSLHSRSQAAKEHKHD